MAKKPTYEELQATVQALLKKVHELKERLKQYENPKNCRNSSIPPSQDENRPKKNQSLRKRSGKKPGGQEGREGRTLKMTATPDEIIELHPEYCRNCGMDLKTTDSAKEQVRQVVDIPPIKAVFTEYQVFKKLCTCGCQNIADFPEGVSAPIKYSAKIEALISYFYARQYLPFARMQEVFNDVFNIKISEGGIHYLLNRFSDKTNGVYELIKQRVAKSKVVGGDETGVKVNGNKHWFWTWQTPKLTFIAHSENRKGITVKKHFPIGFPNSTLLHDGWKPQLNTPSMNHQLCLPHLQRQLNYLSQLYRNNTWAKQFLKLLYDAQQLKHKMKPQEYARNTERDIIIQRLDHLLHYPTDAEHKKIFTFYKRMCRERQHLFTFLFDLEIPSDNNASERAIRNVKVKQKISGQFKTSKTAQNFAQIRSVIDTIIKNKLNVIDGLQLIAKFEFIL